MKTENISFDGSCDPLGEAALPPVRSEPVFDGKWTDADLKAFATARCREIRRKYTREQAQAMCEEMAQLWDIGDDYLKPNKEVDRDE